MGGLWRRGSLCAWKLFVKRSEWENWVRGEELTAPEKGLVFEVIEGVEDEG